MDNETLEGNKLIAEFMGFIWEEKYNGYYKPNPKWTALGKEKSWIEKIDGEKRLKYDSSWDWLMPVIDKINIGLRTDCLGYVDIKATEISSYSPGCLSRKLPAFSFTLNGKRFNGKEKLEAVWLAVIEFIKWYNQNK